jgi:putative endonuclease
MDKSAYVYILASDRNGTLYTGVTSGLVKRVYDHKQKLVDGFTKKYRVNKLVYFETFDSIEQAIIREKQIKHWPRQWRIKLIEKNNPEWIDLYDQII